MLSAKFAERVQCLHHTRALGPAAAGAGGQRDHGHSTALERGKPSTAKPETCVAVQRGCGCRQVFGCHVLEGGACRETILRQPSAAVLEIGPDLLMLCPVKAVFLQQWL